MLQTFVSDVFLAAMHVNASFEALLKALHLASDTPLYGHMVANCIELQSYFYKT